MIMDVISQHDRHSPNIIGIHLPFLILIQAKLSQILLGATELVCKNMKLHQVEAQNYLKEHYPICSKIGPWMKEKLQQVSHGGGYYGSEQPKIGM